MNNYETLLQTRAKIVTEQRMMIDKAESESRSLTAEEQNKLERMTGEFEDVNLRISTLDDQRDRERSLALAENRNIVQETISNDADAEYRSAFYSYLRGDEAEMRDLSKGTNSAGGYTVPLGFYNNLIVKLEEESGVRKAGATVIKTDSGNDLQIPKVTAHGAASIVAEAGTITATDETFGSLTLNAFKYVRAFKVSQELLDDSAVSLESFILNEIARSTGRVAGDHFATGDGSSKPLGVVPAATVGKTTALATAITGDEIIDLVHSVNPAYRKASSAFLMNDAIIAVVRKLKDTTNQYLWQPGLQAGVPDRILGYRVFVEPSMASAVTTGQKTMVFGDFSGYYIRDVNGLTVQRLNERYADSLQVGFVGWFRSDGDLVDTNCVKVLAQA